MLLAAVSNGVAFGSPLSFCVTKVYLLQPSVDKRITTVADTTKFTIICPCCEATLMVDSSTGTLLSHEEKTKPLASFDEMVKGLDKQKQMREQIFAQELSSMKDRDRILEEKFQEAMKRAEKDKDKPYRNPLDID